MKYIFKQIDDISGHNAETTVEFSADSLPDILEHIEMFLRGSGFHPPGTLDFVEDEENDPAYEFDDGSLTKNQIEQIKETHEWTQTLRNDSEWPFPRNLPKEKESNDVMDWTAASLIRPPKMLDVCPICKIDNETMKNSACWDKNCPKGKDAD